jgi:hypothetical protein
MSNLHLNTSVGVGAEVVKFDRKIRTEIISETLKEYLSVTDDEVNSLIEHMIHKEVEARKSDSGE